MSIQFFLLVFSPVQQNSVLLQAQTVLEDQTNSSHEFALLLSRPLSYTLHNHNQNNTAKQIKRIINPNIKACSNRADKSITNEQ